MERSPIMSHTASTSTYVHSKESTTHMLTSGFYLNKYYSANRDAAKASKRKNFENCELVYEDSKALRKASRYLSGHKYSDDEIEENIYSSIMAFKDTYNNAITSTGDMDSRDMKKYQSKLEALVAENEDLLEEIGFSIDSKTKTLSLSETVLKSSDMDKLKEAFSSDNSLLKKTASLSKRMQASAEEFIYSRMTGSGLHINITL